VKPEVTNRNPRHPASSPGPALISVLIAAAWVGGALPAEARVKEIVGRVEIARIYPSGLILRAKIDTGAKTCSLNAPKLSLFTRDGEQWARFKLTNHKGRTVTIERKVLRTGKIKEQNQHVEKRPIILLGICIGSLYREVEVNLVDRSDFNYQLLIGRNYLEGELLVDPELKYTHEPQCFGAGTP
jgi:hypothetical protein